MPKYKITGVDSIPCELVGQEVKYDGSGNIVSEPIDTKWPMPWLDQEISEIDSSRILTEANETVRIYNEEEPDQYVDLMLVEE